MASIKLSKLPVSGPLIRAFFWELPAIIALWNNHGGSKPKGVKKRLLVVRLDAIGDFLLFLGTMRQLRRIYAPQEWEITLLGNRLWMDLAVALNVADHYHFIDLWLFEINPIYRLRTLSRVAAEGFDVLIQGVYSRSFYRDDFIVKLSKASKRIGYYGDTHNSPSAWLLRGNKYYTDLIENLNDRPLHTLQTHARLVEALGGSGSISLPALPTCDSSIWDNVCQLGGQSHFVIVPGASLRLKQWPPERFAGLAEFIYGRTGHVPIILGGKKDNRVACEVRAAAPSLPWFDLSGKTSLMEALAIITNAGFYAGNDTGLTHMATMARVRTLAVVGGAFPGRDFPYPEGIAPHLVTVDNLPACKGCGLKCNFSVDGRGRCIHDIPLDSVIERIPWF